MRIRIQTISPARPLVIQDTLPVGPLNKRMDEAPENEIAFLSDIRLDLVIKKQVQGAAISGTISSSFRQDCGRCGDPIEQPIRVPIDLELKRSDEHQGNQLEDDVGIIIYEGEHIEIDDIIHEHLILALSPVLMPACSPSGDCLICGKAPAGLGAEASGTIRLGDLLKDIKSKKQKG